MRPHIFGHKVICRQKRCENENVPVRLDRWDGSPVWCGACCNPINAEPTAWHVPLSPEELGFASPPQQAADLIAAMSEQERVELAQLIAPAPALEQTRKP